jgi:hypothetical protein
VLHEISEKLAALSHADPSAESAAAGKSSKAAAARDALLARQDALKSAFAATPPASYPVVGLADIRRARAELARLSKLEAAGSVGPGGRMLTPAEALARSHELDARPDIEARVQTLLDTARGWFESDAELEERISEQQQTSGSGSATSKKR